MASNDLVPEKRVNKHGIAVTKHVRPTASPANGRTIPAPSLPQEELGPLINQIVTELPSWGVSANEMRQSFALISDRHPKLAMDIARAYLAGERETRAIWRIMMSRFKDSSDVNEPIFRRAIEVIPLSVELFPDAPPGFRHHKMLAYLQDAEVRPDSGDYSQAKSEMLLIMMDTESVVADDRSERIKYITEHYDDVLRLMPQLKERNESSIEFMRLMVENKSPSLADGVL